MIPLLCADHIAALADRTPCVDTPAAPAPSSRCAAKPLSAFTFAPARATAGPLLAQLEVVAQTGSTNADLMARLAQLETPVLRVAENQTAGRGRAGRAWHSVPGAALMFSLAWKFERDMAGLVGLPLAIGVAVAQTLSGFGLAAQLKWPNDILLGGAKLAGVLIETAKDSRSARATWAVIGIGINVALPATLRTQIGRPVADLAAPIDRNALMAALWGALETTLQRFERDGFAGFVASWNRLDAYAGQAVNILDQGRVIHHGIDAGVDDIGRLRLATGAGKAPILITAGDVSLRAALES